MKRDLHWPLGLLFLALLTANAVGQTPSIGTGPVNPSTPPPPPPPPASTPAVAPPVVPISNNTPFLEAFPQMKSYVYEEPASGFFLGQGLSPIGILKDSTMFTGNFFELHWIRDRYDIEILNAAYAFTQSNSSEFKSTRFTFRAAPKYRFFGILSAGPLIGYELVSFPGIGTRLYRNPKEQPTSEPYSARGWIYGAMLSETIGYKKDYLIQINELAYQETYSTDPTTGGWSYIYDDSTLQLDHSKFSATLIYMLEISFLY